MQIAKKHQNELPRIKGNVRSWREYNQQNIERYHKLRNFVLNTSISETESAVLQDLKKPEIEANIAEAYISRLEGEFSKQEPSVSVTTKEGKPIDTKQIDFFSSHLRHVFYDANQNGLQYRTHKETLTGGFSAWRILADFIPMTFNMTPIWEKCFDPTLTGFDPLARNPSKSDGRFAFELFPKYKEEFEEENPTIDIKNIKFSQEFEGFNWSMTNGKKDILFICDYYEKKKKRVKILELTDKKVVTEDQYNEYKLKWDLAQHIEAPAIPIPGRYRYEWVTSIVRYRLIENQIIEYVETDFEELPIIFVDGNSENLKQKGGEVKQMTRPYAYNVLGVQRLRNFTLQTLANEFENLVQAKWVVAKEAIPAGYEEGYRNIQKLQTVVFNAFKDNDPNIALPPPREVQRPPIPMELLQTLMATDQMMQSSLGSYDASLGINNNQLSGIAIQEGATQSNSAAMPYIVGHLDALNQVAKIMVNLICKYWSSEMTVPIRSADGQRSSQDINKPGGIYLDEIKPNELNIKVSAGVNFSIQKSRRINQMVAISQAFPQGDVAAFLNSEGGRFILENIEGNDDMKEAFLEWKENMKKKQAQQPPMPNPIQLKQQEIQQQGQIAQQKMQLDSQKMQSDTMIKQQQVNNDSLKIQIQAQQAGNDMAVQSAKAQAEQFNDATELAIKRDDMHHNHVKDALELGMKHHDQSHRHIKEAVETAHTVQNDHHAQEMAEKSQESIDKGENE